MRLTEKQMLMKETVYLVFRVLSLPVFYLTVTPVEFEANKPKPPPEYVVTLKDMPIETDIEYVDEEGGMVRDKSEPGRLTVRIVGEKYSWYTKKEETRSRNTREAGTAKEKAEKGKADEIPTYRLSGASYFLFRMARRLGIEDMKMTFEYTELNRLSPIIQFFIFTPVIGTGVLMIYLIYTSYTSEVEAKKKRHTSIQALPLTWYQEGMSFSSCAVCLENFCERQPIRVLDCNHGFHRRCIDGWLIRSHVCPVCRTRVAALIGHVPALQTPTASLISVPP